MCVNSEQLVRAVTGLYLLLSITAADICVPPSLPNGLVTSELGSPSTDMYVGRFSCNAGHTLVGENIIKCRAGKWFANFPVCTSMGKCEPALLPSIANGHKQRVKKYRGSVYKFKCKRGFQRYGRGLLHCSGDAWDTGALPVCTRPGCDSTNMESIVFGKSARLLHGAVRVFSCDEGSTLLGSSFIFCDGRDWNDTAPRCLKAPSRVEVTGPEKVRHGEQFTMECSTSPSSPASSIKWRIAQAGEVVEFSNPQVRIMEEDNGSFVTQSILSTTVTASSGDLVAECYATNTVLGDDYRAYVHIVQVISPPSLPVIRGLPEGGVVPAEVALTLTCEATSGNPPAHLYWYRGNEMLETETKLEAGVVRAKVEFVPHDDDIDLRCEAVNEALSEPVTQSVNIVVDDNNAGRDFYKIKNFEEDDFDGGYSLGTTEVHPIDEFTSANEKYSYKDENYVKNTQENLDIENHNIKEDFVKENSKEITIEKIEVASSALLSEDLALKAAQIQSRASSKVNCLVLVLPTLVMTTAFVRTLPIQ